jgi:hypothetical protein
MPNLKTLNSKSKGFKTVKKEKSVNDEFDPFFLQNIAKKFGSTDAEFRLAFAEAINEKPEHFDLLVNEQKDLAKGFLDDWGAINILYIQLIKHKVITQKKLEKALEKYLTIANKLPKDGKQKKFITAKEIQRRLKNREPEKKESKLGNIKAKVNFDNTEEIERELEEMMEQEKATIGAITSNGEKHIYIPKKKPLKSKDIPKAKPSRTKRHKRSIIAIFNGGEGSGKSKMAQTFPNAFTLDLEDKLFDLIDYDPTLNLQEGEIGVRVLKSIGDKRKILFATGIVPEDDYVVGIILEEKGDINYPETDLNVEAVIGWFMLEGYQFHETLIIDVGKAIRDASVRTEEIKKGHNLGQFEYIPITKANKNLLLPLIHFCRREGKNLVIITHWAGVYVTKKNAQGFDENVKVGREPDVKDWLRDKVTWRIDFLKPDESGFEGKFIVNFTKAPGAQYFKLDITDKNIYDIISSPEALDAEKEVFRKLKRKQQLATKSEAKK